MVAEEKAGDAESGHGANGWFGLPENCTVVFRTEGLKVLRQHANTSEQAGPGADEQAQVEAQRAFFNRN